MDIDENKLGYGTGDDKISQSEKIHIGGEYFPLVMGYIFEIGH